MDGINIKKNKIWIMDRDTMNLLNEYEKGKVEVRVGDPRSAYKKPIKNITLEDPFFGIRQLIFNGPATIVVWTDGSKTVVKCNNEDFDKEKGLAMAICKKVMGNHGNYYNVFKKLLKDKEGKDND